MVSLIYGDYGGSYKTFKDKKQAIALANKLASELNKDQDFNKLSFNNGMKY